MSIGGGGDRSWLEPLNDRGNVNEDTIGCHRGTSEGLNVSNPEPGFVYAWARNREPDLRRVAMNGGIIVTDDMPEKALIRKLYNAASSVLDSAQIYQDVILVKYPEDQIRRIREEEHERSQAMLRSGSDEFLAKVTQAERDFDPRHRGTRFTLSDHSIRRVDERTNAVLDEWTPDQGILNRK